MPGHVAIAHPYIHTPASDGGVTPPSEAGLALRMPSTRRLPPIHGGFPGASGPLGRRALVHTDDCPVHSPTLEQHLLDVAEALEIFRRR